KGKRGKPSRTGWAGCSAFALRRGTPVNHNSQEPSRRAFVAAGLTGVAAATLPSVVATAQTSAAAPPFPLDEITIAELQEGLRTSKYTACGLVDQYIARIEAIDKKG